MSKVRDTVFLLQERGVTRCRPLCATPTLARTQMREMSWTTVRQRIFVKLFKQKMRVLNIGRKNVYQN